MDGYFFDIALALWLGILTSISPCPLATNIAAISFVGRRSEHTRAVLWAGLLYTAGRTLAYIVVGALVTTSLLTIPTLSMFLQRYMNMILGPILLFVALMLFGIIKINKSGGGISSSLQNRIEKSGLWGASLLGILFALTFCPISAALFFGSLIPLSLTHGSKLMMPTLYGIGTALPVIIFAIVMSVSLKSVGKVFNSLTSIEIWVRRVTAVIFVGVGIYLTLRHTFTLF
ncbi:aromatic aminobenezylarsenical efflux permease ArsG family transporter [Chitinispirillales bacterium ANBcel5]|uniref:aromatic aminobenezylarsenical efflux permease ArsG family transporter n=1 Tax=Cellulosispirillum alkaliphilum TaxID=3039283 RepID=UPI002A5305AA|nr:aromatic aminobenezylarsenical efflux permease ArsG family transporter [Chitinispirillales bacterium ANBcel5]